MRRSGSATRRALAVVWLGAMAFVLPSVGNVGMLAAAEPRVKIVDFAFQPSTVTITAGQTVTWQNTGSVQHTVTADGGSFDSGALDPGNQFANRFDKPGTYTYHCSIHTEMKGTVIVKAAAPTATPKGSPTPTPPSGSFPPGFSPNPIQTQPPASPSAAGQSPSDHGPPVGVVVVVLLAVLAAAAVTASLVLRGAVRRRP